MDVKYGLPCVGVTVGDQPESVFSQAHFLGYAFRRSHNAAHQGFMLRTQVVKRRDVLLRNKEDMDGCCRVDVSESQTEIVLVDDVGRDLSIANTTKDTVHHLVSLPTNGLSRYKVWGQQKDGSRISYRHLKLFSTMLLVLLVACAGLTKPAGSSLQAVVKGFHHDLRWGYRESAAGAVEPSHATAFLDMLDEMKDSLHIIDWELQRVELSPDGLEAKVRAKIRYYRLPSTVIQDEIANQVWKRMDEKWVLISQQGGPVEFPKKQDRKSDTKGAEPTDMKAQKALGEPKMR